jgi:5-aminopentanamidase
MSPQAEQLVLGLWQHGGSTKSGDVAGNLASVAAAAQQAAERNVDLLVFPECYLTGYYRESDLTDVAAQVDDNVISALCTISRETKVALVVDHYQTSSEGVANVATVIDPTRGKIATYRKRALFSEWEERVFQRGTQATTFTIGSFRVGVLICYDVEFPELVRELAVEQVDLVVVPTALMAPFANVPELIVPTRALENQVFVAYANRVGTEPIGAEIPTFTYLGHSRICGPSGEVLAASTADEEALVVATLSLDTIHQARSELSYLTDLPKLKI